jgi:GH15 family glucan-1,4-alpha-glucosidase
MTTTPIDAYAFLSDCHSAALVSRAGSVDWLCFPRFDSPSVFGRLLDDEGGHWRVCPVDTRQVSRRYLTRSLVLEAVFTTDGGRLRLIDALALSRDPAGHRLGRSPQHLLVRELHCVDGEVDVESVFAPRPEYGLVTPLIQVVPGGLVTRGGAERLTLTCPIDTTMTGATARSRVRLRRGEAVRLSVQRSAMSDPEPLPLSQHELAERLSVTVREWRRWATLHQAYDGPWRDMVHHSGRVLQALSYHPSGAIVAAPTTSLPEEAGGERNWDYRYSWVRDASYTMEALWVAACPHEATDFFSFMTTAASGSVERGEPLQIMFGVGGEHDLSERTLDHLAGWAGSSPVRVGNGAWTQRQVDVYGELLNAASRLQVQLHDCDDATRSFLVACADSAALRWREPDQGIWEVRGDPRHFLHSKLMCWVALDRASRLGELLHVSPDRCRAWSTRAQEVAKAIVTQAWSPSRNAFTQSFGSDELDASALMIPLVGFLPPDDPRVVGTVEAVAEHLTDARGLVYRYRTESGVDGLAGDEGTFLLCTFWLAHALALTGELPRARKTFEAALACANDVGLLAEEADPRTGGLLGNFPQAFSHIGLVNAAQAIHDASRARRGGA